MSKGKHEAGRSGWQIGGDPFAKENTTAKKQKKKKTSAGVVVMIAVACVAALALLAAGIWFSTVKPPPVSDDPGPGTTEPDSGQEPQPDEGETPEGEEEPAPEVLTGRKEEYYTFLLMGKDTSSGSTDTIILVSYDVPNGTVNCMSIPRDTMVNVNWDIKRINSVYSAKESSGGKMPGLKQQIGYLTGIVPDFYVIIEWKAVGELVDALGGVYFDVPYDMDYDDPWQDLYIHQEKGYRLLDGEDAMQVVRWRKNNDGTNYGDTTRVQVQQDFLKAVASQCLQLKNVTKVTDFARIFFDNVETDVPLNNLLWFAQKAMGVNTDNIRFMTLPGNYEGWAWSRTYQNNQSYVFAYPDEVVEMVNGFFNPYLQDVTEDDLQIMFRNKDGSLGITNGTVLDTKSTTPPVKPPKPAEDKKDETEEEPQPPADAPETDSTLPDDPEVPEEPTLPGQEEPAQEGESGGEPTDGTGTEQPSDTEKPGWL